MEGLWIGKRRCCRGLICFSLTDGNSQRKLITLPSHISMCVRDASRGVSKRVGFCTHLFSCQPELLRACDCFLSITHSLPVSLSFPHMSVCYSHVICYMYCICSCDRRITHIPVCVCCAEQESTPALCIWHTQVVCLSICLRIRNSMNIALREDVKKPLQEVTQEVKLKTLNNNHSPALMFAHGVAGAELELS